MACDTTLDAHAGDDHGATGGAAADLSPIVESTADAGRRERARLSRRVLGQHQPAADRPDPIAILEQQGDDPHPGAAADPLRAHGRLAVHVLSRCGRGDGRRPRRRAADQAPCPAVRRRAPVQLRDLRSPERSLVFDLNDFDETLVGPFEWDAKRLAASFIVAGRSLGWPRSQGHRALLYAMGSYRLRMGEYARAGRSTRGTRGSRSTT